MNHSTSPTLRLVCKVPTYQELPRKKLRTLTIDPEEMRRILSTDAQSVSAKALAAAWRERAVDFDTARAELRVIAVCVEIEK